MAKAKNNTVALSSSSTAREAIEAIKGQLNQLKEITGTDFKTGGNGKVAGFPNSIQDETSIDVLVKMYSSVNGKSKAYDASCADIAAAFPGFACPTFKEEGASAESLKADIILRLKILSVSERKTYLEGLLKEAQEFLTKEDKMASFLEKLSGGLGTVPQVLLEDGQA